MRAGLESRRWWGASARGQISSAAYSLDAQQVLETNANLLSLPPIAKAGPLAWLVRFLRRMAKILIRPWLAVQTTFNRQTMEVLQATHQEISVLKTRLDQCLQQIENNRSAERDV